VGKRLAKKSPKYRNFTQSGVNVMITIFCDFRQFSAKKLAFFSKTNVMIKIFAKTSSRLRKNANIFAKFFAENILKIITSSRFQAIRVRGPVRSGRRVRRRASGRIRSSAHIPSATAAAAETG
jgi:hypothetical protein